MASRIAVDARLATALARLDPEDRAFLALLHVAGLTPLEVAEMRRRSRPAVQVGLERLATRLRGSRARGSAAGRAAGPDAGGPGADVLTGPRLRAYAEIPVRPIDADAIARRARAEAALERTRVVSVAIGGAVGVLVAFHPYLARWSSDADTSARCRRRSVEPLPRLARNSRAGKSAGGTGRDTPPPDPRNEHAADDDTRTMSATMTTVPSAPPWGSLAPGSGRPRGVEERDEVRHAADGLRPELLADPGRQHVLAGRAVLGRADGDPVGAIRGGGRPDAAPGDEAEAAVDLALAALRLVRQGAVGACGSREVGQSRRRSGAGSPGPSTANEVGMPPTASGAVTSTTSASPARRSIRYQSTSPGASRVAPIARESVGSSRTKAVAGDSLPGSTTIGAWAATGAAATTSSSEAAAIPTRMFMPHGSLPAAGGCRDARRPPTVTLTARQNPSTRVPMR